MNAIGEFDTELLEDYLDDALSPVQVEHVARRLAEEPELALAMHELRARRVLRAAAWRTLEPSESHSVQVAGRIANLVRRDALRQRLRQGLWIGSGAAAALMLLVAGWLSRGPTTLTRLRLSRAEPPSVHGPAEPALQEAPTVSYRVALVDSQGRVTPVQKFSEVDQARDFAGDLARYQARCREAERGTAMLVSDHF